MKLAKIVWKTKESTLIKKSIVLKLQLDLDYKLGKINLTDNYLILTEGNLSTSDDYLFCQDDYIILIDTESADTFFNRNLFLELARLEDNLIPHPWDWVACLDLNDSNELKYIKYENIPTNFMFQYKVLTEELHKLIVTNKIVI